MSDKKKLNIEPFYQIRKELIWVDILIVIGYAIFLIAFVAAGLEILYNSNESISLSKPIFAFTAAISCAYLGKNLLDRYVFPDLKLEKDCPEAKSESGRPRIGHVVNKSIRPGELTPEGELAPAVIIPNSLIISTGVEWTDDNNMLRYYEYQNPLYLTIAGSSAQGPPASSIPPDTMVYFTTTNGVTQFVDKISFSPLP